MITKILINYMVKVHLYMNGVSLVQVKNRWKKTPTYVKRCELGCILKILKTMSELT